MARFTDSQVEQARSADLERYLRNHGEKLIASGNEWRWVYSDGSGTHDSVTVRGSEWYDHKRCVGGDTIGFLQEFYDMDFKQAVSALLDLPYEPPKPRDIVVGARTPSKQLELPPRNNTMHRVFAYLTKTRHIDGDVVAHFAHGRTLYEDATHHNAVFVGADSDGKPRAAHLRGTLSGSGFRQTLTGSDTRYSFNHVGTSGELFVFEAPVDMLSYITLRKDDWQRHSYLALNGVSSKPLHCFMDNHTIDTVYLCLDNDNAGHIAAQRIGDELSERDVDVTVQSPQEKDWNDDLTARHSQNHDPPNMTMERMI